MVVIKGRSIEDMAKGRQLYKLLKDEISSEKEWERAWIYCKKIATFVHAPVSLKEYERMEKFADDDIVVTAIASILERWTVPNETPNLTGFDVIGYFYSISLLSVAKNNREQNRTSLY